MVMEYRKNPLETNVITVEKFFNMFVNIPQNTNTSNIFRCFIDIGSVVFFVVHNTNTNGSNPIVECLGEARRSLTYC